MCILYFPCQEASPASKIPPLIRIGSLAEQMEGEEPRENVYLTQVQLEKRPSNTMSSSSIGIVLDECRTCHVIQYVIT